jgi:16S rRNA (guanine966-N2)-methyltransferase
MRIVGGKYKGRIFSPNKKFTARPTTDIAKEALFNILSNRFDFTDKTILDLFSGTGSIGYEFISRGAEYVTFVENHFSHVRFIRQVIELLEINNAKIIREDVFKYLKRSKEKFDIIFCDPPFDLPEIDIIPDSVFKSGILNDEGIFIIEHSKSHDFSKHPLFTEVRRYGKVNFSFFTYRFFS